MPIAPLDGRGGAILNGDTFAPLPHGLPRLNFPFARALHALTSRHVSVFGC